jgi:hypothetical protein
MILNPWIWMTSRMMDTKMIKMQMLGKLMLS